MVSKRSYNHAYAAVDEVQPVQRDRAQCKSPAAPRCEVAVEIEVEQQRRKRQETGRTPCGRIEESHGDRRQHQADQRRAQALRRFDIERVRDDPTAAVTSDITSLNEYY